MSASENQSPAAAVSAFDRFLAQLADRRIFIVARSSNVARWGDHIKSPVDPFTGKNCNAHDPVNWLLPHEAQALASTDPDWILGIVITEGGGLAALDLDHVRRDDGSWDPRIDQLKLWFPDAYWETSQGREGKHAIFSVTNPNPHGTRNNDILALEAYSKDRYIALTGVDSEGELTDYSWKFNEFTKLYFPPVLKGADVEWTDAPTHPDYTAQLTDDELIAKARASQPIKAISNEVRFEDLWTANADVLAKHYPGSNGSYDQSAADMAIANHLAFYTGGNHARIRRLMDRSALKRDKWDSARGDANVLAYAITKAVANALTRATYAGARSPNISVAQLAAMQSAAAPGIPPPPQDANGVMPPGVPPAPTTPPVVLGGVYVSSMHQAKRFEGCVYVEDMVGVYVPGTAEPLDKQQFDIRYPGQYTTRSDKFTESAWECFTRTTDWQPFKVRRSYFDPRDAYMSVRTMGAESEVNICNLPEIRTVPGDASPFITHVRKLLPNGRDAEILLAYMAACVQHKGEKANWAPVLQGIPGCGKTLVSNALKYAMGGPKMCHTGRASDLAGRFNSWLVHNLLIVFDEIKIDHDRGDAWEKLKTYITERVHQIEFKNVDLVQRDICTNFFICTNHRDALPKTQGERRLAMLFCAQQNPGDNERDGLTVAYFKALFGWLNADGYAIVANYLGTCAIPSEFDFTRDAMVAPATTSTEDAIEASRGAAEQEIDEGIAGHYDGFRNGWVSSVAIERRLGAFKFKLSRNRFGAMMAALGYVRHPSLPGGRVCNPLPDGTRPTLYVLKDHPTLGLGLTPTDVARAYWEAQKPA